MPLGERSGNSNALLVLAATSGALIGSIVTTIMIRHVWTEPRQRRRRLPSLILLVRHGESEGNADETLYRTKPDNLVGLTQLGKEQAERVGKRVKTIFRKSNIRRVHLVVSPFARTLQTAATMRVFFEDFISRTDIQPRIREQEFGNLQGDDFLRFREEQKSVGRFWYRFPTGESGADVYDRVKSWWSDAILTVNERVGYKPVDAIVVVTHGLTMRFVLMQLYGWSPTTFHSVWNAGNCDLYLLKKDTSKPGLSPYCLDKERGDVPKSSVQLRVCYQLHGQPIETRNFTVQNYLDIAPPRTKQHFHLIEAAKRQHSVLSLEECRIVSASIIPFVGDGSIMTETMTIPPSREGRNCCQKPEKSW